MRLSVLLKNEGLRTEVLYGEDALIQVARLPEVDAVMAAIVGAAGLPATLAAACAGKRVLLANKEALVMAGAVFMAEVRRAGALLLPIDSEHNAVFQSMPPNYSGEMARGGVRRILLTASGGPFRTMPLEALTRVTPEQAVAHPKWSMGRKISVDSATMMNKGLEVIEAHWLFNAPVDRIEVVIHPQSVIHSLVDYEDGSVLAQLGNPDMRTPIAHALAWPDRINSGVAALDLFAVAQLNFERPDLMRFPCLELAYRALCAEGNAAAVLNAANEVAVAAFLDRRLPFLAIADVIAATLDAVPQAAVPDLAAVLEADRMGRVAAVDILTRRFSVNLE
jgi:1-deoxy-D-xylulose-5-phosphate reductoisomerase